MWEVRCDERRRAIRANEDDHRLSRPVVTEERKLSGGDTIVPSGQWDGRGRGGHSGVREESLQRRTHSQYHMLTAENHTCALPARGNNRNMTRVPSTCLTETRRMDSRPPVPASLRSTGDFYIAGDAVGCVAAGVGRVHPGRWPAQGSPGGSERGFRGHRRH